eukprot:IDg16617t1
MYPVNGQDRRHGTNISRICGAALTGLPPISYHISILSWLPRTEQFRALLLDGTVRIVGSSIAEHCASHCEYKIGPLKCRRASRPACLPCYYQVRQRNALQVDALSQTPCAISMIVVLSTARTNVLSAVPTVACRRSQE